MGYILTIAIVTLLIIVTILLLIFVPKPKCYFDPIDIFAELLLLTTDECFTNIKDECSKLVFDKELTLYTNDKVSDELNNMPKTYEILTTIPNLINVKLYKLDKKTNTHKAKGDIYTNSIIRAILPIDACNSRKSHVWCDGEKRLFTNSGLIVYDPSRESQMINNHKRLSTTLLLIDITRPDSIPKGVA
jgi:hypothetical protein